MSTQSWEVVFCTAPNKEDAKLLPWVDNCDNAWNNIGFYLKYN